MLRRGRLAGENCALQMLTALNLLLELIMKSSQHCRNVVSVCVCVCVCGCGLWWCVCVCCGVWCCGVVGDGKRLEKEQVCGFVVMRGFVRLCVCVCVCVCACVCV